MLPNIFRKRRKLRRESKLQNEIREFYLENSTIDPNKKLWVKIAGEKVQKQILYSSVKDLCDRFNSQKGRKVSYSSFASHRPRQCTFPQIQARYTCACITHENMKILIKYLKTKKILSEGTDYQAVKSVTCEKSSLDCFSRKCPNCSNKKISLRFEKDMGLHSFKKWVQVREDRISEKTKRPIVVTIAKKQEILKSSEQLESYFEQEFSEFLQHIFRCLFQQRAIKNLISTLPNNAIAMDVDWSENYLCKYAVEIQGVHFGASRQQVTIHTGMMYSNKEKKGFATFSDCLRHDRCAVVAHLKKILAEMKESALIPPQVDTIHLISDGPRGQYKNKNIFYLITQQLPKFFPNIKNITHNFSEKGHGKGAKDGIGATVKRTGDDFVKYGTDLSDYTSLLQAIKSKQPKILISDVKKEEVDLINCVLPQDLKTIAGTRQFHQIRWSKDNPFSVHFNALSCFSCPTNAPCIHYSKKTFNYLPKSLSLSTKVQELANKKKNLFPL